MARRSSAVVGVRGGIGQRMSLSPMSLSGATGTPPYPVRKSVAREFGVTQGVFFTC